MEGLAMPIRVIVPNFVKIGQTAAEISQQTDNTDRQTDMTMAYTARAELAR